MASKLQRTSFEARYLTLKDEHAELKKKCRDQETTIRKMQTKVAMIEENMKRLPNGPTIKTKNDREADSLIKSLKQENALLKKKNLELREKLRLGGSPFSSTPAKSRQPDHGRARTPSNQREQELVRQMRDRLKTTEIRMQKLHAQNDALKRQLTGRHGHENQPPDPPGRHGHVLSEVDSGDLLTLQREVKGKAAENSILRSRYDLLESRARAAAEIHERTVHMMEEGNRTIRDLRRKVQALQHENKALQGEQDRAKELEEELRSTRLEHRAVEARMTALCESPFINDAHEARSRTEKLLTLEQTERQQRVQIEHLKETAKLHHAEILALKKAAEELSVQRNVLQKENGELHSRLEQVQRGSSLLEDKMRLYTGDAGIDTSDLEYALTLVKRRSEDPSSVDFLQKADDASDSGTGMKRKLHQLQLAHLDTTRELETAEKMLRTQVDINKDLNLEIEELHARLKGSTDAIVQKLTASEELAGKRLQKIHVLEAQVKQLQRTNARSIVDSEEPVQEGQTVELSVGGGDLEPGENLIEIRLLEANFVEAKVGKNLTTFCMIDFFEYETQASPLASGAEAKYNFSALFKVTTDHFLLRHLSTENLVIEINRTKHADFEQLGQCVIPLRKLLHGDGKISLDALEIVSVKDGTCIGTLNILIQLTTPLGDLFKTYLDENPEERSRIAKLKAVQTTSALSSRGGQNQLVVRIASACDLRAPLPDRNPSPFVHFQLLSFPDELTSIVANTTEPVFNHEMPFPLKTDANLLRLLRSEKLEINVLDEREEAGHGLIGTAVVHLAALARGRAIDGTFNLTNADGLHAGTINLRISWRLPICSSDGTTVLTGDTVRTIAARFMDDAGMVCWRSMLKFLVLDARAATLQQSLNERLHDLKREDVQSSFEDHLASEKQGMTKVEFVAATKTLKLILTAEEVDLTFSHLEDEKGHISINSVVDFVCPCDEAIRLSKEKLQLALRVLVDRDMDVSKPFEHREVQGRVTLKSLLKALKSLGIQVNDEELSTLHVGESGRHEDKESGNVAEECEEIKDAEPLDMCLNLTGNARDIEFCKKKAEFEARLNLAAHKNILSDYSVDEQLLNELGQKGQNAATKVQKSFRGYLGRQSAGSGHVEMGKGLSILKAEKALRIGLILQTRERNTDPDMRSIFVKHDEERTGSISSSQFVQALSRAGLSLTRDEIYAFSAYFSRNSGVDYKAFARFANKDIRSRTFEKVRHLILAVQDLDYFANNDTKLVDEHVFVSELGKIKGLSKEDALTLARVFAYQDAVDVESFVNFAASQPMAISLAAVEDKLRTLIQQATKQGLELEKSFAHFDKNGDGKISRAEFKQAIRELKFDLKKAELASLFARFDPTENGRISYLDFVNFFTRRRTACVPREGSIEQLQQRAQNSVRVSKQRGAITLSDSFEHYDWRCAGTVAKDEFAEVVTSFGMFFSTVEIDQVAARFLNDEGRVSYQSFVQWCAPAVHSLEDLMDKVHYVISHRAIRVENLRAIFERIDTDGSGILPRASFREAFVEANLGLGDSEISSLINKLDQSGEGVRYNVLLNALQNGSRSLVFTRSPQNKIQHSRVEGSEEPLRSPKSAAKSPTQQPSTAQPSTAMPYSPSDDLKKSLQKLVLKGVDLRRIFEKMDTDLQGRVADKEFFEVLAKHDVVFEGDVDSIRSAFDSKSLARVQYPQFLNACGVGTRFVQPGFEEKLRFMIREQIARHGSIAAPWTHFDRNKKGKFDLDAWEVALRDLRFKEDKETMHKLFKHINSSDSGKISIQEFTVFVNDPSYKNLETYLRFLVVQRAPKWEDSGLNPAKVVKEVDYDGTGMIDRHQLKEFFSRLSIELARDAIDRIMQRYRYKERMRYKDLVVLVKAVYKQGLQLEAAFKKTTDEVDRMRYINRLGFEVDYEDFFEMLQEPSSSKDILEELAEIFETAAKKGLGLEDCFQHFDTNKSGDLSMSEFNSGLRSLGIEANEVHLEKIFTRFSNNNGKLRYKDFVKLSQAKQWTVDEDESGNSSSQSDESSESMYDSSVSTSKSRAKHAKKDRKKHKRRAGSPSDDSIDSQSTDLSPRYKRKTLTFASDGVDKLAQDLRLLIRKAHKKGLNYRECFEHFDKEYLGAIDKKDFKSGLKKLGFDVKPGDLKDLMNKFTSSEPGLIKYRDFLRFVAPDDEFAAEQVAERFRAMLAEVGNLRSAFKHFPRNRNGKISRKGFKIGLEQLHFKLSDSELRLLMDIFDKDMDNEISFEDFTSFAESGDLMLSNSDRRSPAQAQVEITLHVVKLPTDYRLENYASIYVRYCFMSNSPTESPSYPVTKRKVKLEFRKKFPIRSMRKLNSYLLVKFVIMGVMRNGEEVKIGTARYDLDDILEQNEDLKDHALEVTGSERKKSKLIVSIRALSALKKL